MHTLEKYQFLFQDNVDTTSNPVIRFLNPLTYL